MPGCQVPGLAVGVSAGLPGSGVSGLSHCRVAAFSVSGLHESDFLFITISHCAWRHVIPLSKATKKRSKENAFNHATLSVHSVQFPFMGAPKARCSPEPRMFEPLLLANPDIDTLRHQCSRASAICPVPARPHAYLRPRFLVGWRRGSLCVHIWWLVHADSAGCSLGRFSHWWRSVSEPVFGERGFHTSFALASTVLLGHL